MKRIFLILLFIIPELAAHAGYGYRTLRMARNAPMSDAEAKVINTGLSCGLAIVFAYAVYITVLYFTRGARNKARLSKRAKLDAAWEYDSIMLHAKTLYTDLQKAWSKQDLSTIQGRVTPAFYRRQKSALQRYARRRFITYVEEVEVRHTSVIYFDDYLDNEKDTIAILIQGTLKDYFHSANVSKPSTRAEAFDDALVLVRRGNNWLLDEILHEPDFYQIMKPKIYIEQKKQASI